MILATKLLQRGRNIRLEQAMAGGSKTMTSQEFTTTLARLGIELRPVELELLKQKYGILQHTEPSPPTPHSQYQHSLPQSQFDQSLPYTGNNGTGATTFAHSAASDYESSPSSAMTLSVDCSHRQAELRRLGIMLRQKLKAKYRNWTEMFHAFEKTGGDSKITLADIAKSLLLWFDMQFSEQELQTLFAPYLTLEHQSGRLLLTQDQLSR